MQKVNKISTYPTNPITKPLKVKKLLSLQLKVAMTKTFTVELTVICGEQKCKLSVPYIRLLKKSALGTAKNCIIQQIIQSKFFDSFVMYTVKCCADYHQSFLKSPITVISKASYRLLHDNQLPLHIVSNTIISCIVAVPWRQQCTANGSALSLAVMYRHLTVNRLYTNSIYLKCTTPPNYMSYF